MSFQAKIEVGRCLALTDAVWSLVTRIFTEYLSAERGSAGGQMLASLTADHLLPCLLRLTAHSTVFAQLPNDAGDGQGDQPSGLLGKFSNAVFHRLQSDRILFPTAVPAVSGENAAVNMYVEIIPTY